MDGDPEGHVRYDTAPRASASANPNVRPDPQMSETHDSAEDLPEILSLAQIQHLMRVEFSRAQRYAYPIVCLVVAVDQLGQLRDRFGYDVKETVVDAVIQLLHRQTRGSDFLGRLPDDRFMVVVPHSPPDKIEVMAQRLVEGARGLHLPDIQDEGLTLSIGGSWMVLGETLFFDDLVQTAQRCLEGAISAGGNRHLARAPEGLG